MGVLSNEMGQGPLYFWLGNTSSVSTTNTDLNAAFVFNTSGTAYGIRITSPVTQSSAALVVYVYVGAKTGTPTDIQLDVYPGPSGADDPQRPGTSGVLGTVTGVDFSAFTAPGWATFTIPSVSLTATNTYWLVFSNNTGTQASNYISIRNRGLNTFAGGRLTGWLTTNGFTSDPAQQGSTQTEVPVVIKFSDGTLIGQPYVLSTNHANNTNDRGVRFRFSQPIKIAGVCGTIAAGAAHFIIYQGASTVTDVTLDLSLKANFSTTTQDIYFDSPITLSANTDYDFMWTGITGASASFAKVDANAASTPPADVTACTYQNQSYVEGTVPGSYNVTANSSGALILITDSFVASAGSSNGFFIS